MKVKICGITNYGDAKTCIDNGVDALGFIFLKKSKRFVSYEVAEKIISKLPGELLKVGVFVNEDLNVIKKVIKLTKINCVQLHGDETIEFINELDFPVIKSFRVNNDFDFSRLNDYKKHKILLDTYSQSEYGGTGKTFNWKIIPKEIRNKIILAGGVSIENIEKIKNDVAPYMVDLSSSLEYSPGKKNKTKVKEFLNKVRELNNVNIDES
ncbi:MAG: phosphoribosylanthranilate isomerase [Ignavibacteria bacterium]